MNLWTEIQATLDEYPDKKPWWLWTLIVFCALMTIGTAVIVVGTALKFFH